MLKLASRNGIVWHRSCQTRLFITSFNKKSPENDSKFHESNPFLRLKYLSKVETKQILLDPHQLKTIDHLDRLHHELILYGKPEEPNWKTRMGLETLKSPPKGIYMHGGVGCGKTFLMDFFFDHSPIVNKRRVHFHKFMLEIHERMHLIRKGSGKVEDPLPYLIEELVRESWLFCLDEFQVTDVADALLIKRIFSAMIEKGSVVVATSNRQPDDLYKNGLQRDLFVPFIDTLKSSCYIHSLDESETDYRLLKSEDEAANLYLSPLSIVNSEKFRYLFDVATKRGAVKSMELKTQGRQVHVPKAVKSERVAYFTFEDICLKPLGAADYLVIAENFDTVFVDNIPMLGLNEMNPVRRFIVFIDCMYEYGIKLYCNADALPHEIFQVDKSSKGKFDEVFAFDRTVSRLMEMHSKDYLVRANNIAKDGTKEQLHYFPEEELEALWKKYDSDGNGHLDIDELRILLEDISEGKSGHRNVPDKALQECLELFQPLSSLSKVSVGFEDFRKILTKYGYQLPS